MLRRDLLLASIASLKKDSSQQAIQKLEFKNLSWYRTKLATASQQGLS